MKYNIGNIDFHMMDLCPQKWKTNYQLNNFINAPMHELGHGVVSDVVAEPHKFST